jgi:pimeloyl-ACP methyl ester carboxylesterase
VDLLAGFQHALRRYLMVRGVRSSVVSVNGHAVHHFTLRGTGDGPPVMLVHGLGGNATSFNRILFPLAKRFSRVIAPDLPGSGFSPLPRTGPLSMAEHLGVLVSFCEAVVGEPAFVVGNSLGGAMSILLTHAVPERVCALALISPAGAKVSPERLEQTVSALKLRNNGEARQLMRRLFHRAPLPLLLVAPEFKKLYGTPAVKAVFDEVGQGTTGGVEPEVLRALKVPVLLIWGQSEKLLPYEGIDYFRAHLPPHAQIQVVDGFGHIPQVERPGEVVRRLIAFADEIGLRARNPAAKPLVPRPIAGTAGPEPM